MERDAGRRARRAAHPGVQKVCFTGSTEVGRQIVHASAGNLKRLQLELGGKGANIVFADADLDAAVNRSVFAIFHNQGTYSSRRYSVTAATSAPLASTTTKGGCSRAAATTDPVWGTGIRPSISS